MPQTHYWGWLCPWTPLEDFRPPYPATDQQSVPLEAGYIFAANNLNFVTLVIIMMDRPMYIANPTSIRPPSRNSIVACQTKDTL